MFYFVYGLADHLRAQGQQGILKREGFPYYILSYVKLLRSMSILHCGELYLFQPKYICVLNRSIVTLHLENLAWSLVLFYENS